MLNALKNEATFLENNKIVKIAYPDVQHSAKSFPGNDFLQLKIFPNRNSLPYKDLYGLHDARDFVRGTIRYQGFCEIMGSFTDLGLLSDRRLEGGHVHNWPALLRLLLKGHSNYKWKHLSHELKSLAEEIILRFELKTICNGSLDLYKLFGVFLSHKSWVHLDKDSRLYKIQRIIEGFLYLGLFSDSSEIGESLQNKPVIEMLCQRMKQKLSSSPDDKDLVVMIHYFEIEYPGRGRTQKEFIKSSMVITGEKGGLSAVSKTVGYTCAIAAKNIINGLITSKGVIGPFEKDVYTSVGNELEKIGLLCQEFKVNIMPKL